MAILKLIPGFGYLPDIEGGIRLLPGYGYVKPAFVATAGMNHDVIMVDVINSSDVVASINSVTANLIEAMSAVESIVSIGSSVLSQIETSNISDSATINALFPVSQVESRTVSESTSGSTAHLISLGEWLDLNDIVTLFSGSVNDNLEVLIPIDTMVVSLDSNVQIGDVILSTDSTSSLSSNVSGINESVVATDARSCIMIGSLEFGDIVPISGGPEASAYLFGEVTESVNLSDYGYANYFTFASVNEVVYVTELSDGSSAIVDQPRQYPIQGMAAYYPLSGSNQSFPLDSRSAIYPLAGRK